MDDAILSAGNSTDSHLGVDIPHLASRGTLGWRPQDQVWQSWVHKPARYLRSSDGCPLKVSTWIEITISCSNQLNYLFQCTAFPFHSNPNSTVTHAPPQPHQRATPWAHPSFDLATFSLLSSWYTSSLFWLPRSSCVAVTASANNWAGWA